MRMLDLFSGRWGWGRIFASRGWDVVGFDLTMPPEIPARCSFVQQDILELSLDSGFLDFWAPDFICASSPCENLSVHGLRCFYPNPPWPKLGIKLFEHTRSICEASGIPYVMENVRAAQAFVGRATHHCGPFYLWGTGVPALMPQGILKGRRLKSGGYKGQNHGKTDRAAAASVATIPPELANCVASYAERLIEVAA